MAQAAPFAIAGLAGLASGAISGAGQARGQQYEAQKLDRAAQIGRVQADQTDTYYREDLASTIANIRAIRASANANPTSPSSLAYIGEQERVSSRERRIRVGGIRMQSRQNEQDASFLRRSAKWSLFGSAASGLISGVASKV